MSLKAVTLLKEHSYLYDITSYSYTLNRENIETLRAFLSEMLMV